MKSYTRSTKRMTDENFSGEKEKTDRIVNLFSLSLSLQKPHRLLAFKHDTHDKLSFKITKVNHYHLRVRRRSN